jgi:hypothetical protein
MRWRTYSRIEGHIEAGQARLDASEYRELVAVLVAEHAPSGPTEGHLVEELAAVFWRKRRLRMAEAAIYRDKIRKDAAGLHNADGIAAAALLPITGSTTAGNPAIGKAIAATPAETARELRDVRRDQAMTRRALLILEAGGGDAYKRTLGALRDDTRSYWQACLSEPPVPARYEIHLDRKMERLLAMLVRLRELRGEAIGT